jgi:hypothetical protein
VIVADYNMIDVALGHQLHEVANADFVGEDHIQTKPIQADKSVTLRQRALVRHVITVSRMAHHHAISAAPIYRDDIDLLVSKFGKGRV